VNERGSIEGDGVSGKGNISKGKKRRRERGEVKDR